MADLTPEALAAAWAEEAICLGEDPKSVKTGVTSVPDLLRDYIAAKGLPYRLVHVPPAIAKPDQQGAPS